MICKNYLNKNLIFILLIAFIIGLIYFNPNLHIAGDNARYLLVAKSLLAGTGYRIINSPDSPFETKYPFGYPLILAFIMSFFGKNLVFLKLFSLLSFIISIWLSFKIFSKDVSQKNLISLILIMALSPYLAQYSDHILTEMPYLFISLLAFFMFKKYLADKRYFIPLVLTLILVFYIRIPGVALLGAIIFYYLFKKDFKKVICWGLLSIFIILPWIIWGKTHGIPGDLEDYQRIVFLKNQFYPEMGCESILGMCFRAYRRIKFYSLSAIPTVIFPSSGLHVSLYNLKIVKILLGIFVSIVAFIGYVKKFVLKRDILEFYFLVYCGIYLIWVWAEERYLVPVLPIILFYFIYGLEHIFRFKKGIILTTILILTIFSNSIGNIKMYNRRKGYPPKYWEGSSEVAQWVKENSPEESLIVCRKPYLFYCFSGRKTIGYKFTKDINKILKSFEEEKIDFVLLDLNDGMNNFYLKPVIDNYKDRFELAYKSEKGEKEAILYRFR